jgi:hypothetical protein
MTAPGGTERIEHQTVLIDHFAHNDGMYVLPEGGFFARNGIARQMESEPVGVPVWGY